jgi:hypothetical protein
VAGGGLAVLGAVLITLSARRPQKPVLTETRVVPNDDALLPLLQAQEPEVPPTPKAGGKPSAKTSQ